MTTNNYDYLVKWSQENGEYVGTCNEYPSLSWLAGEPHEAFFGIRRLVRDAEADLYFCDGCGCPRNEHDEHGTCHALDFAPLGIVNECICEGLS